MIKKRKMEELNMKNLKYGIRIFIMLILFVTLMTGCAQDAEKGARNVTQKYFDALKAGDGEGIIACFLPSVQQEYQLGTAVGGVIGGALFGNDASGLANGFLGYATGGEYQNYDFKATDIVVSDDEHAVVTVEVYIDGVLDNTTEIKTEKYQDEWYIQADWYIQE